MVAAVAPGMAGGAGCASPRTSQGTAGLEDADPVQRGRAVQAVAQQGDPSLAPLLVDRLEDEDAAVRMLAAEGLRRLTGQAIEFEADWPATKRAAVADQWRRRLAESASTGDEQSHYIH
ncbi:MAG: HEAT repeat domain-containing protein [Phycisphaerales bacterium]|nr:HEAT repeat domain-containing protein [Phycisphaerales bacterium]